MSAKQFHRLTIAGIRRETATSISVAFAVPDALRPVFRFTPGQFLTLRARVEGVELRRPYSICSGLDDGELRVAIKHHPGGVFSGWAQSGLRAGGAIEVMPPDGRFGLAIEPGSARTLAAFAAGSGITPILSILRSALARERGRFVLFYGNRTRADIMFRSEIEDLKDRYLDRLAVVHVLSRERQELTARHGRLDAAAVSGWARGLLAPGEVEAVFLCGPAPMAGALEPALVAAGVPARRIRVERFTPADGPRPPVPAAAPQAPPASAALVARAVATFEGRQVEFPVAAGETLIEAGERAGFDLPFACKGGMCCTCRAKLVEGRVEMAANYSLEPWEMAAGYVLTCQSRPLTPRVVVDYDQV